MRLPERLSLPSEVVEIATTLEGAGHETWCVGGAIRDALLGTAKTDVDLATAATPEQVQALFRRTVPVGLKFGTVGVLDRQRVLHEVTTFRRDVTTDGRHAVVAFGASLDDDLARRDFTINAIAYHPLRHEWRDPFGGAADLARRLIRAVGEPAARFQEDYLRILRAIRFASRLDFRIDEATWAAALAVADGMARLSVERVRDEWFRSLETARTLPPLLARWREVGAAARWLPGLRPGYPLAEEAPANRDPVLLTAVVSAGAAAALEGLKASGAEVERARRIERGPAAPTGGSPAEVRRWLAEVGPAADDLLLAHRLRTGADAPWREAVAGIRARGEAVSRGELAVTGDDLRAAGVPPGPALGRLLGELLDLVLEDPSANTRERLLARARGGS
ncbi:MAG: CCA tRNA nucleotidyltransferase [Gemmatimonadetes bacterium]|nr:CCA tRNA nucleotidyltransferase [Gemmatimonadota bacterium]